MTDMRKRFEKAFFIACENSDQEKHLPTALWAFKLGLEEAARIAEQVVAYEGVATKIAKEIRLAAKNL